jgi:ankyrin repeat protein
VANLSRAYFYYDHADQQSQTPTAFARSLLRQLSFQSKNVPSAVAEFYQRTRNSMKDQVWFHDLLIILRRVIATFTRCYLIVDALDEADANTQRGGFFEVIEAIRPSPDNGLRLLVTTRPHTLGLLNRFHNPVTIEILANAGDLRQYLLRTIHDHPGSEELMDDDMREKVVDTLTSNARGLFLLPALQIKIILDQITKADVRRTLLHLSTDLTHAFQSTIQRISSLSTARRDLAFRTLMWLSHVQRPLTVLELQHALAVRLDEHELDRDNFPPERILIDCCCGLVEMDAESSTLRLVHYSLEEYLRGSDHDLFTKADTVIAETCIRYLLLETLKDLIHIKRNDFSIALEHFAFLDYAALEWGRHLHQAVSEDVQDSALRLLSSQEALILMARVRDSRMADVQGWKQKTFTWANSGGAGVSLSARFGLTGLLRLLVSRNQGNLSLNARTADGSTPLHEAVAAGHVEIAQVLLENGADVQDLDSSQRTAVYLAVVFRRLDMVRVLLRQGREQLDFSDRDGFTPLHKAVEQGDEEMVTTLLENGALVGLRNSHGTTALHVAALRGYLSVCQLLVLAGADVRAQDKEYLCPLDLAATSGATDVIAYLAEHGGNIYHKGRELWTPLHRAARGGHCQAVAFFLDRHVNVLQGDFKGNIPLHLAVRSGRIEVVRLLVERTVEPDTVKAQLSATDRKGQTPREVAFFTAHYHIHKYLRGVEWEMNALPAPSKASLVTMAIENGDLDTVRSHLAGNSAALGALDEDGQPPLHVAIQENRKAIVHYLIEQGASIETVGYHGWRALHIAASQGNVELVELCLAQAAAVDARTSSNQTPLHKGASSKSTAVVRRLLAAGADPMAKNDRGMTALHIAAHQNNIAMVRMLVLEYDFDVLERDRLRLTAADWAERSAHLETSFFLRDEQKKARARKRSVIAQDREEEESYARSMSDLTLTEIRDDVAGAELEV